MTTVSRGFVMSLLGLIMLFIIEAPAPSAARSMMYDTLIVRGRRFLHSGAAAEGFAIDLMQYHHVDSPYAKQNITLEERVRIAVESSQERAQYFHDRIYGSSSSSKIVSTTPVYSNQGSYIMQISVGTPPRTFVAIADTGSNLLWVKCSPCQTCSQSDSVFNPELSTSFATLPCTNNPLCSAINKYHPQQACSSTNTCLYDYQYGGTFTATSSSGDFDSETLTLITTTGTSQTFSGFGFGCGHKNSDSFARVDGLVGLGQGSLSLVTQLGSQINHVFSYCLVNFESAMDKTSPLLLGSNGGGTLIYTPLLTNSYNPSLSYYYVNLLGITVDGTSVSYPSGTFSFTSSGGGGFILDSGTTLTYLDNQAYVPFRQAVSSSIDYPTVADPSALKLDLCYNLSDVTNRQFPVVVFQFEDVPLSLPGDNVFLKVSDQSIYCLAFLKNKGLSLSIFGNIQQQNFQIAYDIANKHVGFLAKTC